MVDNSEQLTDDQLIDLLVKTIKQVLATKPQLLFRAFQKCGSDYFFDRAKADLEDKPAKARSIVMRTAICMAASKVLLNAGLANLEQSDLDAISTYVQFVSRVNGK